MKGAPSKGLRAWAMALLLSLVLWNLPFGGVLLYPFKLLASWLHELSHAVAMVATGVGARGLALYPDTSGMAYADRAAGPLAQPIISAAGYMGTPLLGAALLMFTRNGPRARLALSGLAVALALSAWLLMDASFGWHACWAIAAGLAMIATLAPGHWQLAAVQFLAAQACIQALLDLRVLFLPLRVVNGKPAAVSDAHAMAEATFGTTERWAVWTWAGLWLGWALLVCYLAVRSAAKRATATEASAP